MIRNVGLFERLNIQHCMNETVETQELNVIALLLASRKKKKKPNVLD